MSELMVDRFMTHWLGAVAPEPALCDAPDMLQQVAADMADRRDGSA